MTVFWSLAAVMVMVALLFLLPPLLRKRTVSAVSLDDLNTNVIKEQLAELEADRAIGKLDKAQFDAARQDLERELLYDLASSDDAQTATPERGGRWLTLLLIPAIPLCAVLLYQLMGSVELIDRVQQAQTSQPQSAQSQSVATIEEMVTLLATRLQQQPDDLKGWVMLARSYSIMKRYSEATAAYENVLRLGGEEAGLLTDYADAMVMANGGIFTDESGALLVRALELDPDNVKGLQAALKLPAGSEDATVIAQQINEVQRQLGITTESAPAITTATDSGHGVSLSVHVALAPDFSAIAAAEDTVFIYARATQGSRMPLAIVRKQVKDLPVTVTLDDSMAMSPQMVLSNLDQVTVGARVSKSGGAMPQSGDLQGLVSPVSTQTTETIQITISNQVP